jgi:hypothetical protein
MITERQLIVASLEREGQELSDALEEVSTDKLRDQGEEQLAFLIDLYQDTLRRIIIELGDYDDEDMED